MPESLFANATDSIKNLRKEIAAVPEFKCEPDINKSVENIGRPL